MVDIFPDDENGDVLRRMREQGDNLSCPRDVNFSIVFPNEASAMDFLAQIESHFDKVRYSKMETSRPLKWDVTATRFMIPSHLDITQAEYFLANVANSFGGENDGWGCFNVIE